MAMRSGAEFGWRALVGWIYSYGMLHSTPLDLYRLVPDGYGFLVTTLGKKDQSAAETEAALGRLVEVRGDRDRAVTGDHRLHRRRTVLP